ncbi:hypothetical protein FKM82_015697 [Ascaphus truei]
MMSAFSVEPLGCEPMTLGSPTSPKPGAQFLPGFLMGDIPTPVTPQQRPSGVMEMRSPLLAGGSPQTIVPSHKDKSGAPPVRSIYDDISSPGLGSTPLNARKPVGFSVMQTPLSGTLPSSPATGSSVFSQAAIGQSRKATLSPAQLDPFYTQGDALTSDDQLDDTWVTVFGFPQASASYILLQFAQYGNIVKHVMSNSGNWMHIQYQSKLQARKALSKDGRIFGECIMIGVKSCIDKDQGLGQRRPKQQNPNGLYRVSENRTKTKDKIHCLNLMPHNESRGHSRHTHHRHKSAKQQV